MFLGICVEIYKVAKKISGQDAFNRLYRAGATAYILSRSEHYAPKMFFGYFDDYLDGKPLPWIDEIVDEIDEYIRAHTWVQPDCDSHGDGDDKGESTG
jgi:hypothetical protein